jgi:pyruvate ferredoxin oxidoreductase delta subunit
MKISIGGAIKKPGSSIEYKTRGWRTFKPAIAPKKCTSCWVCIDFCPDGVMEKTERGKPPKIDYGYCKGCGICAYECPNNAIEMVFEEK